MALDTAAGGLRKRSTGYRIPATEIAPRMQISHLRKLDLVITASFLPLPQHAHSGSLHTLLVAPGLSTVQKPVRRPGFSPSTSPKVCPPGTAAGAGGRDRTAAHVLGAQASPARAGPGSAQVGFLHVGVGEQGGAFVREGQLADLEGVAAVADLQSHVGCLLHQVNGRTLGVDPGETDGSRAPLRAQRVAGEGRGVIRAVGGTSPVS